MTSDARDSRDRPATAYASDAGTRPVRAGNGRTFHDDALEYERERFRGFKFGSAFFGWLTAMGTVALLVALVAAIGAAIGWGTGTSVDEAVDTAEQNTGVVGIVGAIVVALVLFVAYFAGGYVAGRMARFSGLKQGLAVWLWAVAIAVVVAILTAVGGSQWDVLASLDTFPRIPVTPETATLTGILTAIGAAIVTLAGALLGGVAGMRYHRRVDRVGLDPDSAVAR
jgi:hypothetical protein